MKTDFIHTGTFIKYPPRYGMDGKNIKVIKGFVKHLLAFKCYGQISRNGICRTYFFYNHLRKIHEIKTVAVD